jgi:hypothetical protein
MKVGRKLITRFRTVRRLVSSATAQRLIVQQLQVVEPRFAPPPEPIREHSHFSQSCSSKQMRVPEVQAERDACRVQERISRPCPRNLRDPSLSSFAPKVRARILLAWLQTRFCKPRGISGGGGLTIVVGSAACRRCCRSESSIRDFAKSPTSRQQAPDRSPAPPSIRPGTLRVGWQVLYFLFN